MDVALPLPPLPVAAGTRRLDPPLLGFVIGAAVPRPRRLGRLVAERRGSRSSPRSASRSARCSRRSSRRGWSARTGSAPPSSPRSPRRSCPASSSPSGSWPDPSPPPSGPDTDAVLGGVYFGLIALVVAELAGAPITLARRLRGRAPGPASRRHVRSAGPWPRRRAAAVTLVVGVVTIAAATGLLAPLRHRARRSWVLTRARGGGTLAACVAASASSAAATKPGPPPRARPRPPPSSTSARSVASGRRPRRTSTRSSTRSRTSPPSPSACSRRSGPPIAEGPDPFADPVTRRAIIAAREAQSPRVAPAAPSRSATGA